MSFCIEVRAITTYTCEISDENEKKILNYIKDNSEKFKYMTNEDKILEAVWDLYYDGDLDLYDGNETESDFETDTIRWSEFETITPEKILEEILE